MIRSILCFVVILLTTSVSFATTYYVDINRPDDNGDGLTEGTASKYIQTGVNKLSAGDTLIVMDGTYNQYSNPGVNARTVNIPSSASGTVDNWTTIKSQNKWGAVLDGEDATSPYTYGGNTYTDIGKGFNFSSYCSYIRLEDFKIQGYHNRSVSINQPYINNIYIYGFNTKDAGFDSWNGLTDAAPDVTKYVTIDSCFFHDGGYPIGPFYDNIDRTWRQYLYMRGAYHTIINCVFYNMMWWPIEMGNKPVGYKGDLYFYIANNTFHLKDPGLPWSQNEGYSRKFCGAAMARGSYVWFENNIIIAPPGKESTGGAFLFYKGNSPAIHHVYLRNNITNHTKMWETHDDGITHVAAGWPIESNNKVSQTVSGLFVGGASFPFTTDTDYALNAGVEAIDAGRLPTVPFLPDGELIYDYRQTNTRPLNSVHDIGAWEYDPGDPGPIPTSGSMTFYPTKDAYIDDSAQTSNYGGFSYSALRYDGTKQIRDLTLFDFSALPAGYTITSAKIYKYVYWESGSTGTFVGKTAWIKRLARTDWVEGNNTAGTGVDWLEWAADGGGSWSAAGGDFVEDYAASFVLTELGTSHIYDVTEMAQWCGTNTSELLSVINLYPSLVGVSHVPWFRTREHTTDSEKIKLVINYTTPDGGVPVDPPPPNRWGRLFRVFGF